jgi:YD repeat-containing protein
VQSVLHKWHDYQRVATYIYDSAGNRTSRTDNRTNTTLTYTYDDI